MKAFLIAAAAAIAVSGAAALFFALRTPPFDYGRFEFRFDAATGELNFLEVNLQANLWSEKVLGRSAARAGLTQSQLIETILYEGLRRHGLLDGHHG